MSKRVLVSIGTREYTVTFSEHGGGPSIWTTWDVINPATVWSAHPEVWTRSQHIMNSGKLGKKVLKLAEAKLNKEGA